MIEIKVSIIPLAKSGFIPISERNPVHYWICDEDGLMIHYDYGFSSFSSACDYAETKKWIVTNKEI